MLLLNPNILRECIALIWLMKENRYATLTINEKSFQTNHILIKQAKSPATILKS